MKLNRYALLLGLLLAAAIPASAQNIVMKVMDPSQVPGESILQGFANWTELTAFNAGSSTELPTWGGTGGSAGIPTTKCFTISMKQDKMAYYLKKEMYSGSSLASVEINMLLQTGQTSMQAYYKVLMENVFVTLIEEAAGEDGRVYMNVSFMPERFRYSYYPQNPQNGTLGTPVIFGWNQRTNSTW